MAANKELIHQYEDLESNAQRYIVHVIFTKSGGEKREMWATLNSQLITALGHPIPRKEDTDVYRGILRVFDLQKMDARYISIKRIIKQELHKIGEVIIPPADMNLTT